MSWVYVRLIYIRDSKIFLLLQVEMDATRSRRSFAISLGWERQKKNRFHHKRDLFGLEQTHYTHRQKHPDTHTHTHKVSELAGCERCIWWVLMHCSDSAFSCWLCLSAVCVLNLEQSLICCTNSIRNMLIQLRYFLLRRMIIIFNNTKTYRVFWLNSTDTPRTIWKTERHTPVVTCPLLCKLGAFPCGVMSVKCVRACCGKHGVSLAWSVDTEITGVLGHLCTAYPTNNISIHKH